MAAWIWGANTPDEAVGRFEWLSAHSGPDDSEEDRANFNFYQLSKSLLGRSPTGTEFAAAYVANQSGKGYEYISGLRARIDAEKAAANSPSPTIAPGNPPYNGVSSLSPVPGDGASSLLMGASASAYQPSYIAPAGGVPAPASAPIEQTNSAYLMFIALAVGAFFLLRRGI